MESCCWDCLSGRMEDSFDKELGLGEFVDWDCLSVGLEDSFDMEWVWEVVGSCNRDFFGYLYFI